MNTNITTTTLLPKDSTPLFANATNTTNTVTTTATQRAPIQLRSNPEDYPKIAALKGYPPIQCKVVFVYFIGVPICVLFLYMLWCSWKKFIMWCDADPTLEDTDGLYNDDDIETGVIESVLQVAPILTKLPPDFNFPTCLEGTDKRENAEDMDVLRSSNGSLMSLPLLCNFKLLPCYRTQRKEQQYLRTALLERGIEPPLREASPTLSNLSKHTGRRMSLWPTQHLSLETLDKAKTHNLKQLIKEHKGVERFLTAAIPKPD